MKLFYCPKCDDVVKCDYVIRMCKCGASYGYYKTDDYNAVYSGEAIPLGIDNSSLRDALINNTQNQGPLGTRFEAFVIPGNCKTFKKINWK